MAINKRKIGAPDVGACKLTGQAGIQGSAQSFELKLFVRTAVALLCGKPEALIAPFVLDLSFPKPDGMGGPISDLSNANVTGSEEDSSGVGVEWHWLDIPSNRDIAGKWTRNPIAGGPCHCRVEQIGSRVRWATKL